MFLRIIHRLTTWSLRLLLIALSPNVDKVDWKCKQHLLSMIHQRQLSFTSLDRCCQSCLQLSRGFVSTFINRMHARTLPRPMLKYIHTKTRGGIDQVYAAAEMFITAPSKHFLTGTVLCIGIL